MNLNLSKFMETRAGRWSGSISAAPSVYKKAFSDAVEYLEEKPEELDAYSDALKIKDRIITNWQEQRQDTRDLLREAIPLIEANGAVSDKGLILFNRSKKLLGIN